MKTQTDDSTSSGNTALEPPVDPKQAKLAELRKKRAAFAAEQEAKRAPAAVDQEIEAEERLFEADQAFEKAKDEHGTGNVERIDTPAGSIIVKRPTKILHHWYNEQDSKQQVKASTLEKYVRPCLVWPVIARYEQIVETQPNALYDAANAVARLAGAKRADEIAK